LFIQLQNKLERLDSANNSQTSFMFEGFAAKEPAWRCTILNERTFFILQQNKLEHLSLLKKLNGLFNAKRSSLF
jgi:hypothetical protein